MYTIKKRAIDDVVTANFIDLTSAAVHSTSKAVQSQMDVERLLLTVTTATVSNVSIVVKFWRRPIFGSTSGQVSLGTITIPTATAAGKCLYKDITPTLVYPGEQITFEVTTAAGGGGAAGAAYAGIEFSDNPEAAANQTNMIASA